MKCLELFAGIGGFSAAFPSFEIVKAVDIDRQASIVYQRNFDHPYLIAELSSLPADWFFKQQASLWWMSPPCAPFTRRGKALHLSDPRCAAFKHIAKVATQVLPDVICIENVVGFERSDAFALLKSSWGQAGYHIDWTIACPSQLGWPNLRPRFYAIASLDTNRRLKRLSEASSWVQLSDLIETECDQDSSLFLTPRLANQYESALDRVRATNAHSVAACFAASYGKSVIRSGSYLETPHGLRRFSPQEVGRLLGFPDSYVLPPEITRRQQWRLLGNSLSIPTIQAVFGDAIR